MSGRAAERGIAQECANARTLTIGGWKGGALGSCCSSSDAAERLGEGNKCMQGVGAGGAPDEGARRDDGRACFIFREKYGKCATTCDQVVATSDL